MNLLKIKIRLQQYLISKGRFFKKQKLKLKELYTIKMEIFSMVLSRKMSHQRG
jgi:hypothetical protein